LKPIYLCLENFQCHEKSEINFDDFESILIVGKTTSTEKESNGVGKSTFFKAISFVLFNQTDVKLEKIVRDNTNTCKVTFIFEEDNNTYKIERSKTKSYSDIKLHIKENNDWKDLTQRRATDNQKEIEKLIKINFDAFKNSVLFSQDEKNDLASITPINRKNLLKETLKLSAYAKYEKLAKKKSSDSAKEISNTESTIYATQNLIADIDELKQNIEQNNTSVKLINDKISLLNEEMSSLNSLLITEKTLLQSTENNNKNYSENLKNTNLSINSLNSTILKLNSTIAENTKKKSLLEQDGKLLANQIDKTKQQLESLQQVTFEKSIDELNNEIDTFSQEIIQHSSSIKNLEDKIKLYQIPLPKSSTCSHCRQEMTNEHREKCQNEINEQIPLLKQEITNITKQIEILNKNKLTHKTQINNINSNKSNIDTLTKNISTYKSELENKRSLYKEYSSILDSNKKELKSKTDELNIKSEELKLIQSQENSLNEIPNIKSKIQNLLSQIDNKKKEIHIENQNLNSCNVKKSIIENKIQESISNQNKLTDLKKQLSTLQENYKILQLVSQSFGPSGIPSLIINNVLDDLQINANNILQQLKPSIQLKFNIIKDNKSSGEQEDTLDIIYYINGVERDYQQISGGQKLCISLSLRLALLALLKNQLGTDIKMLLLDEVDQPLDEIGRENFADIIHQLQKDFKILVITHNPAFKDYFDQALLVEQDNNFISTTKLVNNW